MRRGDEIRHSDPDATGLDPCLDPAVLRLSGPVPRFEHMGGQVQPRWADGGSRAALAKPKRAA